jgi:hypothetical protein
MGSIALRCISFERLGWILPIDINFGAIRQQVNMEEARRNAIIEMAHAGNGNAKITKALNPDKIQMHHDKKSRTPRE